MIGSSSETLKIVVKAKDEASRTIKKVSDKAKKAAKDLRGVGVGMTAAGVGMMAVVGKSIKAAQEQEKSEKRLEHLVKQTTGGSKEQVQALKDQATALQKIGVVGDEVTMSGQSQLATFALQTETIEELTPALLDMAVSVKGVNVTQEDMMTISNLLGKVMTGQVGALSRYGVSLTDTQKELLKSGNEMEKAAVLAEVLKGNFGGLNEATRETSEGGMKALQNSIGDMYELIGNALIPILGDIVKKIQPVVENIMNWISENEELTKKIVIGVAALGALMLVLGPLLIILPGIISAVGLLMGAFGLILSPIGLVVLAIIAVIAIGKKLIDNWDVFKASLLFIWDTIKTGISEKIEGLKKSFEIIFEAIKDTIITKFDEIKNFFTETLPKIISGIVEWFGGLPGKVLEKLQSLLETIKTKIGEIPDIIMEEVKGVKDKITQPFKDAGDWVKNFKLPSIKMPDIGGGLSKLGSGIQSRFGSPFNDFISRPGSAPVAFSPDDTIIGVKNPAALGAGGIIINVNGGNYLDRSAADKFAEILGEKLRREIRY